MKILAKIVGVGLFGDQTRQRYRDLRPGDRVNLVRDPDNQHDEAAVLVMIDTSVGPRPVGYLPSRVAGGIARSMDRGFRSSAKVVLGYAIAQSPVVEIRIADVVRRRRR